MDLAYTLLITSIGILALIGLKLLTLGFITPSIILLVVIVILIAIGVDMYNYQRQMENGHLTTKQKDYGS